VIPGIKDSASPSELLRRMRVEACKGRQVRSGIADTAQATDIRTFTMKPVTKREIAKTIRRVYNT
jgi:hypothetical protein